MTDVLSTPNGLYMLNGQSLAFALGTTPDPFALSPEQRQLLAPVVAVEWLRARYRAMPDPDGLLPSWSDRSPGSVLGLAIELRCEQAHNMHARRTAIADQVPHRGIAELTLGQA